MHSSDSSPPTRRRGQQHGNHPGSFFTIPRWMGGGGGGSKKQLQYRSLRSLEDPTPTSSSSATSTRRKRPSLFDQMVRRFFTPNVGHHHRGNSSSDSWNGKFSGPSRSGSLRDLRTRAVGGDPGGGDDTFFSGGGGKRSDSSSLSRTPAVAGIRNEGNTCFMNAVLQCLSNTDAFAEYLVSGTYREDLAQGKNRAFSTSSSSARVTEQLASVLSALWSCRTEGDFAARFKACVEKHGSQYQGSEQHDAQEFLMWLLDKVHEELADDAATGTSSSSSRTKRGSLKRSKSRSSSKGGGGATPWQGSPVAALFAGQLKLRLTCPSCGRQSNNFDPFVCLSLPIPAASQWLCHVHFVPRNAPPTKLAFHVDFGAAMEHVRHKIATECHIPPDQLLLLEETKDGFGSLFEGDEVASAVSANSRLVALELPPASTDPAVPKDSQILVLCRSRVGSSGPCLGSTRAAWVSRELSVTELKKKLLEGIPTSRQSALKDQDLVNRLDVLVWDARQILPTDVDHPLFLEFVDCLLEASRDLAPAPLLRLMLQWEPQVADRLFLAEESIMDDTTTTQQPEPEPSVSLSDCLAFYFTEEKLEPEEAWLCPQCDSRQQGFAQLGLWSCPEVLVIHLKRFHQNGGRHSKLATRVEVPLQDLDLSGHLCQGASVSGSALYDLYAFCSHHGTGLQGGHYTACCKNPVDEQWYLFDDARVRRALDEDLIARDAYLLFYRRQAATTRVTRRSSSPGHWFTRTPLPTSRSHQQLLRGSPLRSTSIPVRGGSIPSISPSGSTDNSLGTQSPGSPLRELVPDLQIMKKSPPESGSEKPSFVESAAANRADGPIEKLNRLSPPPPTKTSPTKSSPTRMNRGSSFRPRPTYLSTAPTRSSTATTAAKSATVATTALTRSTATMTTPLPRLAVAPTTKSDAVGDGVPRPSFLTCSPAAKPASFDITSAKLAAAVDTSATRTGRVALLAAKFSQPERPDNNVTTLSAKWQPEFLEGDSLDRLSLSRRPTAGGGHSPMNGGENLFAPPACSELVYQSEPLNRAVSAPLSPDTLSRRVLSPRVSRSRQVRSQAADFDFEQDVSGVESKASATAAEDVTTPPTLKEAFWTITSV